MKTQPKISVIVPVYKGEKYLAACLDSILAQTFKDFELILLDDGSPDKSGEICDEYAQRDARIRVIHKENEGINKTRMGGVTLAKAPWVTFSDDDDTMEPDALEQLYALREGTDIVVGFTVLPEQRMAPDATIDDCRRAQISGKGIPPMPWAKLYRRSLMTPDIFDFPREIDGEEDMIMNIRLIFKTQLPPHFVYRCIYHFRRNTASVSHTKKSSIRHEEAFYRALTASIPKEVLPHYLPQIVGLKLNGLFPIAYSNPGSVADKDQPYMRTLRDEAKACGYKLSMKERVVLKSRCKLLLKVTGFGELLRRFINYRLSSLR
jgi:glycosyltransferase involved in cell wall biosynthesis